MKTRKPLAPHVRAKNNAMLIGLLLLIGLFFGLSIIRIQERNSHDAQKAKLALHR